MSTLQEIEQAIEALPLTDRLRLYKEMPQLIGRHVEDLDWQRPALEKFFQDDSPEDNVYDRQRNAHRPPDGRGDPLKPDSTASRQMIRLSLDAGNTTAETKQAFAAIKRATAMLKG